MKKSTIILSLVAIAALAISSLFFVSCTEETPVPVENTTIQDLNFQVKTTTQATTSNPLVATLWTTDDVKNFDAEIGQLDKTRAELITYVNESAQEVTAVMTPIKGAQGNASLALLSLYRPDLDEFKSIILQVEQLQVATPGINATNVRMYTPQGAFVASSIATENDATGNDTHRKALVAVPVPVGDGYWACVADCVKKVLTDPFWGALCSGVCAACVVPPHAGCPPCVACLGGSVAGCMLGCLW